MSKTLIIGGAGLLGTYLYPLLEEQGHEVAIVDTFSSSLRHRLPKNYKVFVADATQASSIGHTFNIFKPEIVIICVAYTAINDTIYNKFEDSKTVIHSSNIISNLLTPSIKHVYFCSSNEIYGGPETKKSIKEDRKILYPVSFHGAAKISSETILSSACHLLNIPYTCFRIFDMYGPRITYSARNDVINFIIDNLLYDEQIGLVWAKLLRDFIHVEDVADVINLSVSKGITGIYNIGSGKGITLSTISKELLRRIECKFPPREINSPITQYSSLADITKISKILNWVPKKDVIESLDSLIEFRKSEIILALDPVRKLNSMRGL